MKERDVTPSQLIEALQSGKYKKAKHVLARNVGTKKAEYEYCCLGVLCELVLGRKEFIRRLNTPDSEPCTFPSDVGVYLPWLNQRIQPSLVLNEHSSKLVQRLISRNDANESWDQVIELLEEEESWLPLET